MLGVVDQRLLGNRLELVHQLPQVAGAIDLLAAGGAEDEVAEAQGVAQEVADPLQELVRALVDERRLHPGGELPVLRLGGLQEHRQVALGAPRSADEVEPRGVVDLAAAGNPDVADQRQDVLAVALVELHAFLVGRRQEDLRPRLHVHLALDLVQAFGVERQGLGDQLVVEQAEERRVVGGRVLDHQDHPQVPVLDVEVQVLAVFDVFDDRQQDLRVAAPQEGAVDRPAVDRPARIVELPAVEGEEHHRPAGAQLLDPAAEGVDVHVRQAGHRQHQVEAAHLEHLDRRLARRGVGEAGSGGEAEVGVFAEDLLGELAVLFEDEGVVGGGDEEHLGDPVPLQVVEPQRPRRRSVDEHPSKSSRRELT